MANPILKLAEIFKEENVRYMKELDAMMAAKLASGENKRRILLSSMASIYVLNLKSLIRIMKRMFGLEWL